MEIWNQLFLLSSSSRCHSRSLHSLVRCRVEHSKRNSQSPRDHVLFFLSVYTIYTYIYCIASSLTSSLSSSKLRFWSLKLQRVHLRSVQEHSSPNQDINDDDWPSVRMPVTEAPDMFMKMSANNSSLLVNVIAINLIVVMLISFVLILFYK